MKVKLFGLALVVALVGVASAIGASSPITEKKIAAGANQTPITVAAKAGAMLLDTITIKPGGNFGWHRHGSAVAVVITSGTLTVYDPSIGKCKPFTVSKGQAFVEPPNHLHLARNDTSKPVTLYAMYLGLPKGVHQDIPGTQPAGCNA